MLTGGAAGLMAGGGASLVMPASGYANPTVSALVFGTPTVLVLARLAGKAKAVIEAAPATHHHHNNDVTIDRRSINSQPHGVIANTRNQA